MGVFTLFLAIFVVLHSLSYAHQYSPEGWEAASKFLREFMDDTVDPCDDFYSFVCGNWDKMYGERYKNELERVFDEFGKETLALIDDIKLDDDSTQTFKKSLKTFYQQCNATNFTDWKPFMRDMYEKLQKYLVPNIVEQDKNGSEIYPWNPGNDAALWKFVGTLQRELRISFLISADVDSAEIDCVSKPVIRIRPSFNELDMEKETLNVIFNEIVSNYHNVSLNQTDVNDTINEFVLFQSSIKTFLRPFWVFQMGWLEPDKIKIKYNETKTRFRSVDWSAYFDGLLPDEMKESWLSTNPTIIIENELYFENLTNLLNQYHRITVTNYGFLLIFTKYYYFFRHGVAKLDDTSFSARNVFRHNVCLDLSVRYFAPAILRLISEKHKIDVDNWRNDVIMMKENIFSAFRFLIHSTEWMNPEDKMKLITKANKLDFSGGIPKWIVSNKAMESKTAIYNTNLSLVENEILAQKQLFKEQLKPLITGEMDDAPPTFIQNAFHRPRGTGAIFMLLGLQLPPFYMYTYPLAAKYGMLGSIVGHELMHGFSTFLLGDHTYRFGSYEILNLTTDTVNILSEKLNCSIPLYNTYCTNETACAVGHRTLEENTADIEGLSADYLAYKFVSQTIGGEPLLENLVDYTSDQVFFISYARLRCGRANVTKDMFVSHSPHKARVEQPLMNFPPFAHAFNCPIGSRYARNKTCFLYGNNILNDDL